MKRALAAGLVWGLPVMWRAHEPEPAPVQAAVVREVHHYLHLPDGQVVELPQQRAAITSAGEHHEAVNP